ncbi:MAG: hypothetical protein HY650_11940 [Acidobacteria bacterium]|nr:hypothetical protein [Acidobacteriota bacterium]
MKNLTVIQSEAQYFNGVPGPIDRELDHQPGWQDGFLRRRRICRRVLLPVGRAAFPDFAE